MIPLVGTRKELEDQDAACAPWPSRCSPSRASKVDYMVGTMIEVPRAALTADEIAGVAEFFSFGTNDLTQMTLRHLPRRRRQVPAAVPRGRDLAGRSVRRPSTRPASASSCGWASTRAAHAPDLKVGICGEQGGDPATVKFCHRVGMNYV